MDALHTVHAALVGVQEAPDQSKGTVWEANTGAYGVVMKVITQLIDIRGAILFHTSPFRSQPLEVLPALARGNFLDRLLSLK
jgi:hypothetical protein